MTRSFAVKGNEITIKFPDSAHANLFKDWLCDAGEQCFWEWTECAGFGEPQIKYRSINGKTIFAFKDEGVEDDD